MTGDNRVIGRVTATMVIAAAAVGAAGPAVAQAGGAAARIGAYDDAVVAIMKAGLPLAQRVQRFQAVVGTYYDMPGIAAAVAGPAWAGTPAGQRQQLTDALTRHSAISLARNFAKYGGERFTVDPAVQQRGADSIVKLTIAGGSSSDVLYFRMRQAGGGWRIVDVISGGVSQLAVQRADLATSIAASGVGGAAAKLAQMDAKVK